MNEPMVKAAPAVISAAEFYDRARARLSFDVPSGLIDPNVIPESGDVGTDRNRHHLELVAVVASASDPTHGDRHDRLEGRLGQLGLRLEVVS